MKLIHPNSNITAAARRAQRPATQWVRLMVVDWLINKFQGSNWPRPPWLLWWFIALSGRSSLYHLETSKNETTQKRPWNTASPPSSFRSNAFSPEIFPLTTSGSLFTTKPTLLSTYGPFTFSSLIVFPAETVLLVYLSIHLLSLSPNEKRTGTLIRSPLNR